MTTAKPARILVLADRSAADPALLAAIRVRAARAHALGVIDGVIYHEPIDEIILSQAPHPVERWFHVDLPHRRRHLKLSITTVDMTAPAVN